ncbi:MAG: hypothetical protein WBP58_00195 [Chitinophagaceae bacterium]
MNTISTTHPWTMPGPSATSSAGDFDFLVGKWRVENRKLRERLNNNNTWDSFPSEIHLEKALGGFANVERYLMPSAEKMFEGLALRLFNPETRLWTIYWMDTSNPVMDTHPVTGSFEDGVGKFYAMMEYGGLPCLVIYQWDARDPKKPIWSQAFSVDHGETWEWNWYMHLERIAE